ncbi:hypothetical protein L6452_04244 [Arctium lappa]|uniref:Uncharacterized protein n=1 Tax=Arctium lappa TaxID=4217 RepID=A0ACB9FPY6_ARCLA|nr:hypothetical protein L6452_04244 [Arctium lappa]
MTETILNDDKQYLTRKTSIDFETPINNADNVTLAITTSLPFEDKHDNYPTTSSPAPSELSSTPTLPLPHCNKDSTYRKDFWYNLYPMRIRMKPKKPKVRFEIDFGPRACNR